MRWKEIYVRSVCRVCLIHCTWKHAFYLINFVEPLWLQALGISVGLQICRTPFPCSCLGLHVPIAWEALWILKFRWDQMGPEREGQETENLSSFWVEVMMFLCNLVWAMETCLTPWSPLIHISVNTCFVPAAQLVAFSTIVTCLPPILSGK